MLNSHARCTVVLNELLKDNVAKARIDEALSTYPLYVGKKEYDLIPTREQLNTRLLNHYKYREIGFESVGRFIDEIEIVMNEIMPYYNEMFKSVEIMADLPNPFDNVDVVETIEDTRKVESTSQGSSETEQLGENNTITKDTRKHSDTPQSSFDSLDKYVSDYSEDDGNSSGTSRATGINSSTGSGESLETYSHKYTKLGNQGVNTYAHDMNEFRTSIIDVVDQIINDPRVNELFMLVY